MNKFFILEFRPDIKVSKFYHEEESEDQMRIDKWTETTETLLGHSVSIRELVPLKEKISEFTQKYSDLCISMSKFQEFGVHIEVPAMTPRFCGEPYGEVLHKMDIDPLEDWKKLPEKWSFQVHFGIRGWYINAISKRTGMTGELHRKFFQYGFKDFYLEENLENISEEVLSLMEEISETVYEEYIGSEPDQRYSLLSR